MVNTKPRKRGRAAANAEPEPVPGSASQQNRRKEQELPLESVRRYITRYNLRTRPPMTFCGFLCQGSVGKHTVSGKRNSRSTYKEASTAVKEHLRAGVIKEGEAIAEFIYSMQLKDRDLKVPLDVDNETTEKLDSVPEEAVE